MLRQFFKILFTKENKKFIRRNKFNTGKLLQPLGHPDKKVCSTDNSHRFFKKRGSFKTDYSELKTFKQKRDKIPLTPFQGFQQLV